MPNEHVNDSIPTTEQQNPASYRIDTKSTLEILRIINDQDKTVPFAVEKVLPEITALVDTVVAAFKNNGRLFYIGSGTSGRLGVLDASECPPTYGVSTEMVQGIIAGGEPALTRSKEGAEDDGEAGIAELKKRNFSNADVLVGISASGDAQYVVSALRYGRSVGAVVGAISCNRDSKAFEFAEHRIHVEVGPEIIAGSTRMKSGTAQKLILNMISTTAMIRIGKVYNNYMVDLCPLNAKLVRRAKRLISQISGCTEQKAELVYGQSQGNVKAGIIMAMLKVDRKEALLLLEKGQGSINFALDAHGGPAN